MKHVEAFHGSITRRLTEMGLDSRAVLNACNAFRGSIKSDPKKAKHDTETKLTGQITAKGLDNRKLTFKDSITEKAETEKGSVPAPGRLLAFSDALKAMDKYGHSLVVTEFEPELEEWLNETVAFRPVQGPAPKPETETQAA